MSFTPSNWYWRDVAGRVFSSAKGALVPATDATFAAWLASGKAPTPWPVDASGAQSNAALDETLASLGLPASGLTPSTQAQLLAYAEAKRAQIAAGGISVNIAAVGAAQQLVEVGTDAGGLALLANAVQLTSTAPGTSFDWDQAAPVTLTGAQIVAIQVAVGLFNQLLFSQKTAVRAAIVAGTITTPAQIDDPTTVGLLAWPQNS